MKADSRNVLQEALFSFCEHPMQMQRQSWTFLSNHSHVLIALAGDPELRLRDLSAAVGITERAVAHILSDLEDAGVIERSRVGRRNSYRINGDVPLRHPVEGHRTVNDILTLADKDS